MGNRYPKKDAEHLLGDVIQKVLEETRLARPYLEHRVVTVWAETVGPLIAQYTSKVELKGDTLYETNQKEKKPCVTKEAKLPQISPIATPFNPRK